MPPLQKSISQHLRVEGLDRDIIRSRLQNEAGRDLMRVWGRHSSKYEVVMKVQVFIKAVVDNFRVFNGKYLIVMFICRYDCLSIVTNSHLFFTRARSTARRCWRMYSMDCGCI